MTGMQSQIAALLSGQELSGRVLRGKLEDAGKKMSMVSFYKVMADAEDAGIVIGEFRTRVDADGETVKERFYKLA